MCFYLIWVGLVLEGDVFFFEIDGVVWCLVLSIEYVVVDDVFVYVFEVWECC